MAAIRSRDTKPEVVVRRLLHRLGFSCPDGHLPISGKGYWYPKLRNNRCRDAANVQKLRRLGWRVLTIWECQLDSLEKLERRLRQFLC